MKNATIYSASPEKLTASSLKKIPSLSEVDSDGGILNDPSWFNLRFGDVTFRLNVMAKSEIPEHIRGFSGYAMTCHKEDPIVNVEEVLSYIAKINQAYGLITNQEFDFGSEHWTELKNVANIIHGVIFACDSLVDTEELVVFGPLGRND